MHPDLFRIGPWEVRSYGAMLALSFLGGVLLFRRRAPAHGVDPRLAVRVGVIALAATFIGARLAYVLVNPGRFREDPLGMVRFWGDGVFRLDGLVMNGGLLASIAALWAYLRWKRQPVLGTLDAIAPALGLGLLLTRIGCFLNGCCYGKPTAMPWGVVFPAGCPAGEFQRAAGAVPATIHPTQLYAALYGAAILLVSIALERRKSRPAGFTLAVVLSLYGAARFGEEVLRHYQEEKGIFLGLTHNQHLSIALVLGGGAALAWLSRRGEAGPRRLSPVPPRDTMPPRADPPASAM